VNRSENNKIQISYVYTRRVDRGGPIRYQGLTSLSRRACSSQRTNEILIEKKAIKRRRQNRNLNMGVCVCLCSN